MFGIPPIRIRAQLAEKAEPVASSSFASTRTKALLDEARKQHGHILANKKLSPDVQNVELAAVNILESMLAELLSAIAQHDNPPSTLSKRTTLIKVEKARRQVLTAVREHSRVVKESKRLFEEVGGFVELRPDESLSPRELCTVQAQRPPVSVRKLSRGDSLCASIMGLSDIANTRDVGRDSPYAPAAGSPSDVAAAAGAVRASSDEQQEERTAGSSLEQAKAQGALPADAASRPALGAINVNSLASTIAPSPAGKGMNLLTQQPQQRQAPAPAVSSADGEDDPRPSPLHDVPQLSDTTTMCNMDSCVTGQQRGAAGQASGGLRRRSDERYQDGDDEEDDEEDEDEVNSAEGRCVVASPNHRVSLLGPRHRPMGPLAIGSADSTVAAPSPLDMQGLRAKYAQLLTAGTGVAVAAAGTGEAAVAAAAGTEAAAVAGPLALPVPSSVEQQGQQPVLPEEVADQEQQAADAASTADPESPRAGVEPNASPSMRALAEALRSQESITAKRSHIGFAAQLGSGGFTSFASQQRGNDTTTTPDPFTDESVPECAAGDELDTIDPRVSDSQPAPAPAAAPAPLSAATRYSGAHQQAACDLSLSSYRPQGAAQAPASCSQPLPEPVAGASHAAATAAPHPPRPHRLAQQHGPQHPALAAASAAAAAHPFTSQQQHALPASGTSSLREFPLASRPGRGPAGDRGGASGGGSGRHSSQPPSMQQSLDSGRYPASATITTWDNASIADTEPLSGAPSRSGRRQGRRRNGLLGVVRSVVGFVGVSVLSGAAMVLGAAAVNTSLDEQEAANQARSRGARRGQRLGRGGEELIPQGALQQLRSPDLLALGRG